MRLNNHSYVHKKIRILCYAIEQSTNLKLITNFDNDFSDIRFMSRYSYLTIDYLHNTIFAMCIKLDKKQIEIIDDIITMLNWITIGETISKQKHSK